MADDRAAWGPVAESARGAVSDYIALPKHGYAVCDRGLTDAAHGDLCEKQGAPLNVRSAIQIGERLGAQYACLVELTEEDGEPFAKCWLVDVETGETKVAGRPIDKISDAGVAKACASVMKALFSGDCVDSGCGDATVLMKAVRPKSVYLVTGNGDDRMHWRDDLKAEPFPIDGCPWHGRFEREGDVFEAGKEGEMAVVRKNGEVHHRLSDGTSAAEVHGVVVFDGDVYAVGWESNERGNCVATVWKNGSVCARLSDGSRHASARSICVRVGDVYVAGHECNHLGNGVATVWKNGGVCHRLTDGSFYASARSVCVSGDDVYAAGYERDGLGHDITTIWKNGGVLYRLGKDEQLAEDYLVFVR